MVVVTNITMGWIEQGNLRIYSISDTIGQFTTMMFNFIETLFTKTAFFIMILFFLSLLFYFWVIITSKLRDVKVMG